MFSEKSSKNFCFKYESFSSLARDKTRDIDKIFQKNSHLAMCAVLLLMNLADPARIRVECDNKFIHNFLCYFEDKQVADDDKTYVDMNIFAQSCVMKNKICYLFKWIKVNTNEINPIKIDKNFITLNFEYLFDAVSVPFPPIISPDFKEKLTYRKYGRIPNYNWHPINKPIIESLYVFKDSANKFNAGGNLFKCEDNVLISIKFVCDGNVDCTSNHSTDELGCLCSTPHNYSPKCKYIIEGDKKSCSFYYWRIKTNICELYPNLDTISKQFGKVDLHIGYLEVNGNSEKMFDKSMIPSVMLASKWRMLATV